MASSTGLGQPAWGNRSFTISCHALVIIEGSGCDGPKPLNTFICMSERQANDLALSCSPQLRFCCLKDMDSCKHGCHFALGNGEDRF